MQLCAEIARGPRQAQGVVEGVQVAGAEVQGSAVEALAGGDCRQLRPVDVADLLIAIHALQTLNLLLQLPGVAGF